MGMDTNRTILPNTRSAYSAWAMYKIHILFQMHHKDLKNTFSGSSPKADTCWKSPAFSLVTAPGPRAPQGCSPALPCTVRARPQHHNPGLLRVSPCPQAPLPCPGLRRVPGQRGNLRRDCEKRQPRDAESTCFQVTEKNINALTGKLGHWVASAKLKFPFVPTTAKFTNSSSAVLPSTCSYRKSRKKSKQVFSNLSQCRL